MQTERRPDPDALLAQLGLAAPTVRGGWRGETGAGRAFVLASDGPEVDRAGVDGSALAAPLVRLLRGSGMEVVELQAPHEVADVGGEATLVIVVDEDDRPGRRLAEVNRFALAGWTPWLPVSAFDGGVVHVGPIIQPHRSACFECVRRRMSATPAYASLYDSVIAGAPAVPMPDPVRRWAYATAALLLAQWLGSGGRNTDLPGRLFTLDPYDLQICRSAVLRVPRCPACGGADRLAPGAG